MIWTDWEQLKKNLALEREQYTIYEVKREILEKEVAEMIDRKRKEIEEEKIALEKEFQKFKKTVEERLRKKERKLLEEYQKNVEKEFKTSLVI